MTRDHSFSAANMEEPMHMHQHLPMTSNFSGNNPTNGSYLSQWEERDMFNSQRALELRK
jgi:hypothetical protein